MARALLVTVFFVASCNHGPCGPSKATVTHVIDGDTIELDNGDKVRYLLVDAPETTKGHDDCYGPQAADFNDSLVNAMVVSLTYDPAQCMDIYGRWLAYVTVGNTDVNKALVQGGFACEDYIPPAGTSRKDEFDGYVAVAKDAGVGLWGACNPVTCK
jgi:micrococcal nuclease